ncbi:MAG: MarR family transcriptional regulator [Bacteroidota bacterium]
MDAITSPATLSVVDRLERGLFELAEVYRKHKLYIKTKYNISALEMEILQLIHLDGKKKMKEIGEQFHIKLSTLTSIIDKIESQKLVKRVNSREDRRVVFLDITKKGQKLYEEYHRYLQLVSVQAHQSMEDYEFQAFLHGLKKMSEIISSPDID